MTLSEGDAISHYRLERLIGQGGMGAVYQAHDVTLGRPIAIKIMHPHYAGQPAFQERFAQEARAVAQLDHPSIVKVHDFGLQRDMAYMVMEYISGGSLATYIQQLEQANQLLHLDESLRLLAQVAEALGYAHRRGMVHRDVKPDNILLKPLDEPPAGERLPLRAVVTDFGLVKLLNSAAVTQPGLFMGTLAYMAPEQVLEQSVDGRADLYALGVILYQLATGRLPLNPSSPTDAVLQHLHTTPPPPAAVRPSLPPAVAGLIETALARAPEQRFQTGEALARALRQVADRLQPGAHPIAAPEGSTTSLITQMGGRAPATPTLPPPSAPPPADSPTLPPAVMTPPPSTPVTLTLHPQLISVAPGVTTRATVTLTQTVGPPRPVTLQVSGAPAAWVQLTLTNPTLEAGTPLIIPLTVNVPSDAPLTAGQQAWAINVLDQNTGQTLASADGWFQTPAQAQFQAELPSPTARPQEPWEVLIHNQGNTPGRYVIQVQDASGHVRSADQPLLEVAPGAQGSARLTLATTQPRPRLGRARRYPFQVLVTPSDAPAQQLSATLLLAPRLSWLVVGLVTAGLLLVGGLLGLFVLRPLLAGGDDNATPVAQATLSPTVEATLALSPTATPRPNQAPSPSPTAPPPTPAVSAQVTAQRVTTPPTLDGQLEEWGGAPAYQAPFTVYTIQDWDGSDDLSGVWQLAWDDNFLYVAVVVVDDQHVQTQTGNQIFRGDSVDLQIDTQREADLAPGLSPDDYQITLSPGDFGALPPSAWRFRGRPNGRILDEPGHSVQLAASRTTTGYQIEAAIPWRDLTVTPALDLTLGLALNVNDNDTPNTGRQEVMKSHVASRTLTDPTTWGTLTLR